MWYVIYDSDGNPVAATGRAERIGQLIADHYKLVDSTPGADEPFLTVKRESGTVGLAIAETQRVMRAAAAARKFIAERQG